jgi:hypothetical protein
VSALIIDTLAEHGDPNLKNKILIAGTDVGVFVTTDGGGKWYTLGSGLPHIVISDIKLYKNMLIAATHGRSLYALDIRDVQAAINADVAVSASQQELQAFPNPTRDDFAVSGADGVTACRFIDLTSGRTIDRAVTNALSISTSGIPSGSYAVELIRDRTVLARTKLTIVK